MHCVPYQKHFFGGSQILEVFTHWPWHTNMTTTNKMSDKWPSKDLTAFHTVINGYLLDCWVRKKKSDWNKFRNTFFTWDIQIQERSLDKTLNKFTLMTDIIKAMHNIRQWAEVSTENKGRKGNAIHKYWPTSSQMLTFNF